MIIDLTAWGWPQWVYFGMIVLNVILGALMHGKPRKPVSFPAVVVGVAIAITILYFGGFWGNV